jgi:hypothetical protein
MKKTWGEILREDADKAGRPLRTLEQIQACIAKCRRQKSDKTMARLMLNQGRMTDEARAWLSAEYPQG